MTISGSTPLARENPVRLDQWEGLQLNWEDVARKFNGTIVFGVHAEINDGRPIAMHLTDMDDRNCVAHFFTATGVARDANLSIRMRDLDVLHAVPPVLGAIPAGKGILFVQRVPARQWQVGVCRANTRILNKDLVAQVVGLSTVRGIFDPVYTNEPYTEVLKRFDKDKELQAYALSPTYWFARRVDKIVLYRNQIALGSFVYGTFFVNQACSDLKQELWDDLRIKVQNGK